MLWLLELRLGSLESICLNEGLRGRREGKLGCCGVCLLLAAMSVLAGSPSCFEVTAGCHQPVFPVTFSQRMWNPTPLFFPSWFLTSTEMLCLSNSFLEVKASSTLVNFTHVQQELLVPTLNTPCFCVLCCDHETHCSAHLPYISQPTWSVSQHMYS